MLKLLAFVLPLGLDSFAVAAAIGALQVTNMWQRLRISLVLVIFEGGMPLIGLDRLTMVRPVPSRDDRNRVQTSPLRTLASPEG